MMNDEFLWPADPNNDTGVGKATEEGVEQAEPEPSWILGGAAGG